jgi:hypothetical protein
MFIRLVQVPVYSSLAVIILDNNIKPVLIPSTVAGFNFDFKSKNKENIYICKYVCRIWALIPRWRSTWPPPTGTAPSLWAREGGPPRLSFNFPLPPYGHGRGKDFSLFLVSVVAAMLFLF